AGGILPSYISRLVIVGNTVDPFTGMRSVAAAADSMGTVTLLTMGAALWTRTYVDPLGPPTVVSVDIVSNVEGRIVFNEEINSGSLILSQDIDNDGTVTGLADVLGSVLVINQNGTVLDDVTLTYTTQTTESGVSQGVLILRRAAGFGTDLVTVTLSGRPSLPDPVVHGHSGLRSARMDLTSSAVDGILVANSSVFPFGDLADSFLDALSGGAIPLAVDSSMTLGNSFESSTDIDVIYFAGSEFQFFSAQYTSAASGAMALFYQDTQGTATTSDDTFEALAKHETGSGSNGITEAFELPGTGNYFLVIAPMAFDLSNNLYTVDIILTANDTDLVALSGVTVDEIAYVSNAIGDNNNNEGFNTPKQLVYLDFDGGTATKMGGLVPVSAFDLADFAPTLDGNEDILINGGSGVYGIVQHVIDKFLDTPASYLDAQGNPGSLIVQQITMLAEWTAATTGIFFTTVDPATWGLDA
ncbi:hypothetical protein LCGC14_2583660, partial [marine sediment metagenome]